MQHPPPRAWIALACGISALLAGIGMVLPWHELEATGTRDSGLDHAGHFPILLFGTCCVGSLVAAAQPSRTAWRIAGIVALVTSLAAGALVARSTLLAHFLSEVRSLPGSYLYGAANLAAIVFGSLVFAKSSRFPHVQPGIIPGR